MLDMLGKLNKYTLHTNQGTLVKEVAVSVK